MSKLILTHEVSGLGSAGDVVDVKNGYARNYLVPQGFAVQWTKGGEKQVEFHVTRRDLSYWDVKRQNWVMPSTGTFGVSVGFSSRNLPLEGTW